MTEFVGYFRVSTDRQGRSDLGLEAQREAVMKKYGLIPPKSKPWATMRDVLGHLPDPTSPHAIADHEFRDGAKSYPGHTGSMYDLPSKTIKVGAHGVPGGENMIRFSDDSIRYLTVHEAKIIQGFPQTLPSTAHGARRCGRLGILYLQ